MIDTYHGIYGLGAAVELRYGIHYMIYVDNGEKIERGCGYNRLWLR